MSLSDGYTISCFLLWVDFLVEAKSFGECGGDRTYFSVSQFTLWTVDIPDFLFFEFVCSGQDRGPCQSFRFDSISQLQSIHSLLLLIVSNMYPLLLLSFQSILRKCLTWSLPPSPNPLTLLELWKGISSVQTFFFLLLTPNTFIIWLTSNT